MTGGEVIIDLKGLNITSTLKELPTGTGVKFFKSINYGKKFVLTNFSVNDYPVTSASFPFLATEYVNDYGRAYTAPITSLSGSAVRVDIALVMYPQSDRISCSVAE